MTSFRRLSGSVFLFCLSMACQALPDAIEPDQAGVSLRCGDGIVGADEACDDGERNSNSRIDACRKDCRLAHCGDHVTDTGEGCDDGNPYNADGCSTECAIEDGEQEEEPNDVPGDDAQLLLSGMTVFGVLEERDQDCYGIRVPNQGYLTARVGDGQGGCMGDTYVRLYGPDNERILARDDNSGVEGCSLIDPQEKQGARHLGSGLHSICVQGFMDIPVSGYALTVELGADSCAPGAFEPIDSLDNDNDGILDACDDDDDDDRVPDEEDNCPNVSNGPYAPVYHPNYEGFIRHWLLLGAWNNELARCLPTEEGLVPDEAGLQPEPYQVIEGREWLVHRDGNSHIDLNQVFPYNDQFEAYAFAHVRAPAAQRALLAVGSDDGMRTWLNGEAVMESAECRGAEPDQNVVEVDLLEGWNRLLIRVKDLGGGWGFYARFLNEDGTPVRGLSIQHTRQVAHDDNQIDRDGNGIGDACEDN